MITRYSDHAANERTFLAWVRTAIAMMAFGFVIERFDLFLRYAAPLATQQKIRKPIMPLNARSKRSPGLATSLSLSMSFAV